MGADHRLRLRRRLLRVPILRTPRPHHLPRHGGSPAQRDQHQSRGARRRGRRPGRTHRPPLSASRIERGDPLGPGRQHAARLVPHAAYVRAGAAGGGRLAFQRAAWRERRRRHLPVDRRALLRVSFPPRTEGRKTSYQTRIRGLNVLWSLRGLHNVLDLHQANSMSAASSAAVWFDNRQRRCIAANISCCGERRCPLPGATD